MAIEEILVMLCVGAASGWLAGLLVKGRGFGLLADILLGILGAFIGGFALGLIGITLGGILGSIIKATIGAVLLLLIVRLIKRA
ncbi:GlsB/YeaQ/YmgE family stress response membrane protein [Bermanella marisrubri]|uniref:Transglycosylase associated protein n=1 Tax=Bermanella marisrubri TaxID=207949 RepID=Q1N4I2_9GAMM|nr:GlsB/YeaQ/YmgE family stress response membrane protein [Bermanella marisrubri]EAT13446.1 hypothetical protein RED65_01760 [Oceanobacter sp. RED65] [Bermanella marisrubri]QIZ84193.1 GlsB/YeaQ/YmgE family stress response membrane protein [Bermanella marisrubri]